MADDNPGQFEHSDTESESSEVSELSSASLESWESEQEEEPEEFDWASISNTNIDTSDEILCEIGEFEESPAYHFNKNLFRLFIREIAHEIDPALKFEPEALEALQVAAEAEMRKLFKQYHKIANAGDRVKISREDIKFVHITMKFHDILKSNERLLR